MGSTLRHMHDLVVLKFEVFHQPLRILAFKFADNFNQWVSAGNSMVIRVDEIGWTELFV